MAWQVFNRGSGRFEVADYENQKYAATFDQYHEALAFAQYKNTGTVYHHNAEQFSKLLDEAVGMFLEYRDKHGYTEEQARYMAVKEIIDGTEADRELYLTGMDGLKLQLLFF